MEDLTGKQLGPYQVIEPLGEGGMATIYKAYQPAMDRHVALKILPDYFANNPQFVTRFEQEAKIVAQLQHPHILPVFDYGGTDDYPYIAMPFIPSGDLTDFLQGQPLPLHQIRRIISQVGDALDYAHQQGLVHRDVKPSNILLDQRGNCLLTDFGIAKIVEGSASITSTGVIVGTPAYMSPEQGMGKKLDGRSDIYSLGIILYELATGRVPYRAETPMAVVVKHIHDPLPLPRKINPNLPEAVERVILKALTKEPDDRYATAADMVRALQTAIPETVDRKLAPADEDATLISSPDLTSKGRSQEVVDTLANQKPARSGRTPIFVAVGVVILLIIGTVAFFAIGGNRPGSDAQAIVTPGTGITAGDDTLLYDDFDDPAFEGKWNTERWVPIADMNETFVEQSDGVLAISREAPGSRGLRSSELGELNIADVGFVEAKIKLDNDVEASQGDVGIVLFEAADSDQWWFGCNIGAGQGNDEAWAGCDSSEDYGEGKSVHFDSWHTFRFEINPDTAEFTIFIDGEQIDRYLPAEAEAVKQTKFYIDLRAYSEDGGLISGYIDDVHVGQ